MKKYPRYVRISNPSPAETGVAVSLGVNAAEGEHLIAFVDGSIYPVGLDRVIDIHVREFSRRQIKWLRGQVSRPPVFLSLFVVWMSAIWFYFGWRAALLAVLASVAAVLWDRSVA